MDKERKINREATIKNILKKAKGSIKNMDSFNAKIENEEFLKDSALYWEAKIVYE
jgi:hypothetical protein